MRNKQSMIICFGIAFVFLIIAIGTAAAAEAPVEEWNRTFGGANTDIAYSVQNTSDGGYILGGNTRSFGAGGWDSWVIKTDSEGTEEWNRTFGYELDDLAHAVKQTSDDGYILAGKFYVAGDHVAKLIKINSTGNEQWNKTFGKIGHDDDFQSVQQTLDGGYILAGSTSSFGAGYHDAWLVKTTSTGHEQWNKTFGGTRPDFAYSVQQTSDGGYIITGNTDSEAAGDTDAWLIKTDSNGNEEWNKIFDGPNHERVKSVQQTSDGGYILAGSTSSFGEGEYDFWLIKTDSVGTEQWNKTFGGPYNDIGNSVQQTSDDGYILAGSTLSFGAGGSDVWIIKTNPDGTEQWNKTIGTSYSHENGLYAQQISEHGYILAGRTGAFGAGTFDAWLIKLGGTDPIEAIEKLKEHIDGMKDVDEGTKASLNAKLDNAIHHLEKGEKDKAIEKLENFIDFVDIKERQRKLSAAEAEYLKNEAERIIDLIQSSEG